MVLQLIACRATLLFIGLCVSVCALIDDPKNLILWGLAVSVIIVNAIFFSSAATPYVKR